MAVTAQIIGSIDNISAQEWDACACPETSDGGRAFDPFTTHRFLLALENSGSVHSNEGWQPAHLIVREDQKTIACAPMYVKTHSQGEYIFDFNWADAYMRAGGQYYPKLQIAVPFTPATGRRLLVKPGYEEIGQNALINAAKRVMVENGFSSLHITFCTKAEAIQAQNLGLLARASSQFHWINDGFENFDAYLAALSSRKRKNIKKERATAQSFGGQIEILSGNKITSDLWDDFWEFYQDTGSRKWGRPYLTRKFFDLAHETLRDDMALVIASREGQPIAGALNFIGRDTLFGRYWGAREHVDCLHFECCYYQAMEYAIANGISRIEAGAQGEHKLARGYLPVKTHSMHAIADSGFADAVEKFLIAEADAVDENIEVLTQYGPFSRIARDEAE